MMKINKQKLSGEFTLRGQDEYMQVVTTHIPIYDFRLDVTVHKTLGARGLTLLFPDEKIFIGLCSYTDQRTLVHECSHAVDFIGDALKATWDTESRAYLLDYIYKQVVDAVKELKAFDKNEKNKKKLKKRVKR